jgi:hypothetical protein
MIDRLERYASTDDHRPHLHRVMRHDRWLYATDGRCLVAVAPPEGPGDVPEIEGERRQALVGRLLDPDPVDPVSYDLAALRAWLGPYESACEVCGVAGRQPCTCEYCGHEHDAVCVGCNGAGTTGPYADPDRHAITVAGQPVNRRLLAWALDGAPGERVEVGTLPSPTGHPAFALVGDGWRAVVMGLAFQDGQEPEAAPALPEPGALPEPAEAEA